MREWKVGEVSGWKAAEVRDNDGWESRRSKGK